MKRLESLAWGVAIAVAATLTAAAHQVETQWRLPFGVQVAANLLLVAVSVIFVREFIAVTVLRWRWLRRLLLRTDYVEGTWINVVDFHEPTRQPMVGIVEFRPEGTSLRYSGENLDLDGCHLGHFRTRAVEIDLPSYYFTYGSVTPNDPFGGGMGLVGFVEGRGPPSRFTGYCLDGSQQMRHTLIGRRVEDERALRRLADPDQRAAEALRLAQPLLQPVLARRDTRVPAPPQSEA